MKMKMSLILGMAVFFAVPAMAQNDGTLPAGQKPAIKTGKDAPPAMPVPGKTSFTSDEARDLMMKRGYNIISIPIKDDNGIWYAEGIRKDGLNKMIMVDYQGNVFEGEAYSGHETSAPGAEVINHPVIKPISPEQH